MKTAHRPVKSLGQNFLNDERVQQRIVDACDLNGEDTVIEIGPGQGAITHRILPLVKKLIAVEKDRNLVSLLKETYSQKSLEVIEGDFLKWDMGVLEKDLVVLGNIPYYISTPIIEKIIKNRHHVKKAFMTVQLEFAERLAAKAGNKDYGSLSCFVQYYMDVKILFKISKGCFSPAPKVDSCFISLIPKLKPDVEANNEEKLFKVIQTSFMQRRKTLVNALKGMFDQEQLIAELKRLKINPLARPEEITLLNYIEICNSLVV